MWPYLFLAEVVLLFSLPTAEIFLRHKKITTSKLRLISLFVTLGFVALTIGAVGLKLSFQFAPINFMWFLVGYAALCLLAVTCLRMQAGIYRWLAITITGIPIFLGHALATVGFFILLMITAQNLQAPHHSEFATANLVCEVGEVRSIAARRGQTGKLYVTSPFMPLVRREVGSIHVSWLNRFKPDGVFRTFPSDYPVPTNGEEFCSQLLHGYQLSRQ